MVCSYYSFALLVSTITNRDYIKIIIKVILLIGLLNVIYGIFQIGFIKLDFLPINDKWKYAKGFLGNSMNYALLMSLCYFISIGILLENKTINISIKLLLLFVYTIGLIISGSMSVIVTMFLLLFIIFVFKMKSAFDKKYIFKIIGIVFTFIIITSLFIINNKIFRRDINELFSEISYILNNKSLLSSFGTGRVYIWENAITKSCENLIFGVGTDNFFNAFNPVLIDQISGFAVDKAHNDYLQRLVCEGVFSLSAYLVFIMGIIYRNYKKKDSIIKILLLGFLGYIVCISFNISVIRVAPLFWIVVGILMGNIKEESKS